ncbi:MAG: hypothetical protein ACTSXH_13160 [Promethearchaeota archaeon]
MINRKTTGIKLFPLLVKKRGKRWNPEDH